MKNKNKNNSPIPKIKLKMKMKKTNLIHSLRIYKIKQLNKLMIF